MKKTRFNPVILILAIFALAASSMAQAQATRTWVSGVGDDANPCSRTAPCKTFAGAISKTATNGEISVLDPGGYGAVTITKSITIDGSKGAGFGSILAASTNGIIINITDMADTRKTVILRNLSINGGGTGLRGINILAAAKVIIADSQIFGFNGSPGVGINDTRAGGKLIIYGTEISHNLGSALLMQPTALVTAALDRVQLSANSNSGIFAGNNARVTISDSVVAGNISHGLFADGTGIINSENVRISNNGNTGVITTSGGTIRLSNAVVTNNGVGFKNGGTINTFTPSSNKIMGNIGANVGALTPIAQQ